LSIACVSIARVSIACVSIACVSTAWVVDWCAGQHQPETHHVANRSAAPGRFFSRTFARLAGCLDMEYRGKRYSIVQGIGGESWTWTVHLNQKTSKSGRAKTRQVALTNVVWLIDRALAPKNEPSISPCSEVPMPKA
jgi:hypothetical protein